MWVPCHGRSIDRKEWHTLFFFLWRSQVTSLGLWHHDLHWLYKACWSSPGHSFFTAFITFILFPHKQLLGLLGVFCFIYVLFFNYWHTLFKIWFYFAITVGLENFRITSQNFRTVQTYWKIIKQQTNCNTPP
jgi:hypothetical protein